MKKSPQPKQVRSLTRRDLLEGTRSALGCGFAAAAWPLDAAARRPQEERSQSINIRVLVPDGSQSNLEPIVAAFEEATGHKVSLSACGTESVATEMLLRSLADEVDFDVALPPTFSIPDLVEADILEELDPFLPEGRTLSLYPLGDVYKGATFGLQTDGDVYLMFYARDMLEDGDLKKAFEDRAGRPLGVPATWEELDETMEFMHAPAKGRFGGALFRTPGYIAWEFWARLHGKGVFPVADDMRPLLDGPEGLAAGEELVAASQWLHPTADSAGLFENWETFSQGKTFCNIGWGGSQKYFHGPGSKIRNRIEFAPLPGGVVRSMSGEKPAPIPYFNWGWNFTVSRHSPIPEEAAKFALFATEGQASLEAIRAQDGFFDPYHTFHYDDEAVNRAYSETFLQEHRRSLTSAIPDFYLAGRGDYFDLLGRSLARANAGKTTVKEALTVVARGWDRITDRQGRDNQIAQWSFLKSRYPAQLRNGLRSS